MNSVTAHEILFTYHMTPYQYIWLTNNLSTEKKNVFSVDRCNNLRHYRKKTLIADLIFELPYVKYRCEDNITCHARSKLPPSRTCTVVSVTCISYSTRVFGRSKAQENGFYILAKHQFELRIKTSSFLS